MKRMYSKNELLLLIASAWPQIVGALKGHDIDVNGITSKGIANTGGFANIGDVAISGNLNVQGEGKGVITANEVKEEYDTDLIDLSSYINNTEIKSNTLYAKMKVKHGLLMIVLSGCFITNEIATAQNMVILSNIYSLVPEQIRSKIFRSDGTNITEASSAGAFNQFVAGMISPRNHGTTQSSIESLLVSNNSEELTITLRGFPALAEDTKVFIDVRFTLEI